MQKIKVAYIISNIDKALAFEWVNDHLDKKEFELVFVLLSRPDTELYRFLRSRSTTVYQVRCESRLQQITAFFYLLRVLLKERPRVVHTHLFEANILGLIAAYILRINKRMYTRHHAMTHHRDHAQGKKWDRLCNRLATHIIAISENIKNILIDLEHADPAKIHVIRHGFDLPIFDRVTEIEVAVLRQRYSIPKDAYPIVGVIARYIEWKGVQFIIPAFRKLLLKYPKALLILCNTHGDYAAQIRQHLLNVPSDRFIEIKFENNLPALYKLFNVYVHTPIDDKSEAFGQTYVEALAAKVPSIFTKSGIASEFITHRKNALVVDHQNSDAILQSITEIADNPVAFDEMVKEGYKNVNKLFHVRLMIEQLQNIYK